MLTVEGETSRCAGSAGTRRGEEAAASVSDSATLKRAFFPETCPSAAASGRGPPFGRRASRCSPSTRKALMGQPPLVLLDEPSEGDRATSIVEQMCPRHRGDEGGRPRAVSHLRSRNLPPFARLRLPSRARVIVEKGEVRFTGHVRGCSTRGPRRRRGDARAVSGRPEARSRRLRPRRTRSAISLRLASQRHAALFLGAHDRGSHADAVRRHDPARGRPGRSLAEPPSAALAALDVREP